MIVGETRYAHSDGHTDAILHEDGKYIISCGNDGEARIWDTSQLQDESPLSVCLGNSCASVAANKSTIYASVDGGNLTFIQNVFNNGVASETDIDKDKVMTFDSEILHIACDEDVTIVGCADGKVFVIIGEDKHELKGHNSSVLSVLISKKLNKAVTASCDGSVRIWSLTDYRSLKRLEDVFVSNDNVETVSDVKVFHRLSFIKGQLIVAADRSLKCFNLDDYSLERELEVDEIIDDEESIYVTSHSKTHFCVTTNQGLLIIYSLPSMDQVYTNKFDDVITSIVPITEGFAAFTEKGELMVITTNGEKTSSKSTKQDEQMDEDIPFDPDNDEVIAGSHVPANKDTNSDDDDDGVDLGAIKAGYMPTILGEGDDNSNDKVIIRETVKTVHVKQYFQKPFQVGEVPARADNDEDDEENLEIGEHRFLTYNHVGFVICSMTEEETSIEVDFHNTQHRHSLTLPNKGYSMAALDGHAVVLANEQEMDVYLLDTLPGETSKSWQVSVPKNDTIIGVTLGQDFIVLITENNDLRIFSIGGFQRLVLTIPGRLVSAIGASAYSLRAEEISPPAENLLIFYHNGAGVDDCQNISMMRLRITKNSVSSRPTVPLGLPKKIEVKAVGFTEEFRPFYMNSKGRLFIYGDRVGSWYQVFDAKQSLGKHTGCFVVSVGERYNRLTFLPCRRWSPKVKPLPVMAKEKLQMPVLDADTDKSQLEGRRMRLVHLRNGVVQEDGIDTGMAKVSLQLLALALKGERFTRAMEIIESEAKNREALDLFLEYTDASNKNNRYDRLLKKISQLLDDLQTSSENVENESELFPHEEMTIAEEEEPAVVVPKKPDASLLPILAPKRIALSSMSSVNSVPDSSPSGDFNPFKKSGPAPKLCRPGQLDAILMSKPKPSKIPCASNLEPLKPVSKQAKLNMLATKAPEEAAGPVQMFLEHIRDELLLEYPDADEQKLFKLAAEKFRMLSKEERTSWLEKGKNPSKRLRVD